MWKCSQIYAGRPGQPQSNANRLGWRLVYCTRGCSALRWLINDDPGCLQYCVVSVDCHSIVSKIPCRPPIIINQIPKTVLDGTLDPSAHGGSLCYLEKRWSADLDDGFFFFFPLESYLNIIAGPRVVPNNDQGTASTVQHTFGSV
jgi:hypothetical protein